MSINVNQSEKLRDLLGILPSTYGSKLPTAKEIRESKPEIVWSKCGITVYKNGFYTYTDGLRTTVFAVDRCLDSSDKEFIAYSGCDYTEEEWLNCPSEFVLFIFGDYRLMKNNERRERNNTYSYDNTEKESIDLKYIHNFEEDTEFFQLIGELPERQEQVIRLWCYEKFNQKEISEHMRISPQAVNKLLKKALENLKKYFSEG